MISKRTVREPARVGLIAVLAVAAFIGARRMDVLASDVESSTSAARTNAQSVQKVEKMLADVCKAATDKTVRQAGRGNECRLAEAGNIEQAAPVVQPQVKSQQVSRQQLEQVVDAYLENRLKELPSEYRDDLRRAVVDHLRANPPAAGKDGTVGKTGPPPTPAQIAPVVAAYVSAHPPAAGKDGRDGTKGDQGVSLTGAALDGCDLVFSFSDTTTVRVGPICGPTGKDGGDGRDGRDGKKGDTGRGIIAQNCVDGDSVDQDSDGDTADTDWLITYDQPDANGDSSQRVDGPCRIAPPATPFSGLGGR